MVPFKVFYVVLGRVIAVGFGGPARDHMVPARRAFRSARAVFGQQGLLDGGV